MTNGEKCKTAHERAVAFTNWCKLTNPTNIGCVGCVLFDSDCCQFSWLDLEAEEEKPETIEDVIDDMAKAGGEKKGDAE